jgi:hypothetical protein
MEGLGGYRNIDANDIVMGTFACLLGPITFEDGVHASMGSASGSSPYGFTPIRCMLAGLAANVSPDSLVSGDSRATQAVRRALESSLAPRGISSDVSRARLAFFDKGVSAAREARFAYDALVGQDIDPASASGQEADEVRAHRELESLHQFGRNLGATKTGSEAQALAWIIAVDRFIVVKDVPARHKSLVAEPLFTAILNVPAPGSVAGRPSSTWSEYLATAARTAGASSTSGGRIPGAIGGGPSATTESANLIEIARTSENRLLALGEQLASLDLRAEIGRTVARLQSFELESDSKRPSDAKPRSGR